MFTRKMQTISQLGVKVKGEGRNYKLVECAMRRRVSVLGAPVYAREELCTEASGERRCLLFKRREKT